MCLERNTENETLVFKNKIMKNSEEEKNSWNSYKISL